MDISSHFQLQRVRVVDESPRLCHQDGPTTAERPASSRRSRGCNKKRGDDRGRTHKKGPAGGGAHDKESESFQRSPGCWMMDRLKSSSQSKQTSQGYSGLGRDRIREGQIGAHASSDKTAGAQIRRHLRPGTRACRFYPASRSLALVFLASSAMKGRGTTQSGYHRSPWGEG
jgi:hypothetical protein